MVRWPEVTLAEACTKIQDGAHRSPQVLHPEPGPGRFPYLTSKNIRTGYLKLDTVQYCEADFHNEIYPRCNPELGDILLTKDGANTGNVAINTLNEPFSLLSSVCLLKPDPANLLSAFLFYYIQSKEGFERITGQMTGAAIKRIILKTIKCSRMPLPPLHEQERIVAIIEEAFAAIATATANAEKNLANARELFESYLNNVFTQKGDGWVEMKFGDTELLQIIDGDRGVNYPKKSDFHNDGHCLFLNTKNVRPDGFDFETRVFITEEKDKILRKGKLQRRDVILTTRGTIGNIAIYDADVEFEHIRINSGMLVLRPNESIILSEYLFEVLRSGLIKRQIAEFTSGAAQPQLPIRTLVQLVLPVPKSLEKQTRLVMALGGLSHQVKQLESIHQHKLDSLTELKQSILHKAFTGELTADASTADRALSEAGI